MMHICKIGTYFFVSCTFLEGEFLLTQIGINLIENKSYKSLILAGKAKECIF